jgi:hypothetical protein
MTQPAEAYEVFSWRFPRLQTRRVLEVMHVEFAVRGAALLTPPLVAGKDLEALLLPARIAQGAAVGGARAAGAHQG